jgi:cytoskeletal protein CcmA (bactofilin family)
MSTVSDRKLANVFSGRSSAPQKGTEPLSDSVGAISSLTVIGKAMVIRGRITSTESMHIDGQVDGTLEMPDSRLTIGPNGRVGADAKAREIEVLGTVAGDLEASKKITIRKGGRLVGDLRTPGIIIEEGAYFKGKIEIVDGEEQPQLPGIEPDAKKATVGA